MGGFAGGVRMVAEHGESKTVEEESRPFVVRRTSLNPVLFHPAQETAIGHIHHLEIKRRNEKAQITFSLEELPPLPVKVNYCVGRKYALKTFHLCRGR